MESSLIHSLEIDNSHINSHIAIKAKNPYIYNMKLQSPKAAFILSLFLSIAVFAYVNYCPSANQSLDQGKQSLLLVSKDLLHYTEFEVVVKACKAVISSLIP